MASVGRGMVTAFSIWFQYFAEVLNAGAAGGILISVEALHRLRCGMGRLRSADRISE